MLNNVPWKKDNNNVLQNVTFEFVSENKSTTINAFLNLLKKYSSVEQRVGEIILTIFYT